MEIDTALTKRRETLELPKPKKDNNEDYNKSKASSRRAKKKAPISRNFRYVYSIYVLAYMVVGRRLPSIFFRAAKAFS